MLDIYGVCLDVAEDAMRTSRKIAAHSAVLADQLERAGTSVVLNVSEGAYSKGGNRRSRYQTAMGSASEVRTIFELSERFGWITREDARHAKLSRIIGTLVRVLKLAH